jgi:3-phosphoshikimate 1-carboxyvinyltransferase
MSKLIAQPANSLSGEIKIPGDKSISHRSIMLGSIANGITKVSGFLKGEDTLLTLKAFQDMGIKIEHKNDDVIIYGSGLYGLKKPLKKIYLGNSGTSMRLMSGILAAQNFDSELFGDKSLTKRPMDRIIKPLNLMGASIKSNNGKPPLIIKGRGKLKNINYTLPVASAQIKSCILLASLYSEGQTCINEPIKTRDHTEIMLNFFGYKVNTNNNKICINGGKELVAPNQIKVPGDISSAAFFIVAAIISKNTDITLIDINVNPARTGIINILQLMGANIELINKRKLYGELIANIKVKSSNLKAIKIPKELISSAIDEFPAIFIAASCAEGETILTDAKELRVKESDRIKSMNDGLTILGIKTKVTDDGIRITGGDFKKPTDTIQSYDDHRIAMAFAIASLKCKHAIKINDIDNISTSFPNFIELANLSGMKLKKIAGN